MHQPGRMKASLLTENLSLHKVITPHLVFCSKQHQVPWLVNNAASFLTPPYDPDEFLDVLLCDCSPLFFSNSLFFILSPQSSVLNPHHIQINSWVQVSLAWGTAGLKSYSKYMSANVCVCVHAHMHSWRALKDLWIIVLDSEVLIRCINQISSLNFQRKEILLPQSLSHQF